MLWRIGAPSDPGASQRGAHGGMLPPGFHINIRMSGDCLQRQEENIIECVQRNAIRMVLG